MKAKKQPEQLDLFRDYYELEPSYEPPSAEDLADMRECMQALKQAELRDADAAKQIEGGKS